jgi:hypothetical protein
MRFRREPKDNQETPADEASKRIEQILAAIKTRLDWVWWVSLAILAASIWRH